MFMIKCFSFWKSLKQLFIILLISCFTLLVGSSVNAWEYFTFSWNQLNRLIYQPVWDIEYFQNVGFKLMNYWELQSNYSSWDSYDLLYFPQNWQAYQYWNVYYGWVDNKLYYYWDYWTSNRYKTQWFIQNFCKTTKELLFDVNNWPYRVCDYNLPADTFYSESHDFTNIYSMSSVGSTNAYVTSTFRTFCLEESNWVDVYCWSCWMYDNQNQNWGSYPCDSWLTWSLNFDIDVSDFSSVANIPWSFSPWGWSGWSGSLNFNPDLTWNLVISSWYTNSDMVKGFECVGLQPSLCYWWFSIDNIFQPWEKFEDFTGYKAGQGATIFEIYNLYSWSFSSLNQFLTTVLNRYQNWQINSFITEPKALIMLWAQMNTAWFKTSYIASYCNLLLNENNNNLYTWNSVDDLRVQSCLRSQKIWDSLKDWFQDIWFQTSSWWIFSWWDVDFDPDTFFSNIMDTIDKNLNQNLSWWFVGILPWYIVLIFLALVFIRLITH